MDESQAGETPPYSPAEEPVLDAAEHAPLEEGGPAGFWVRAGAAFLDGLVMLAMLLVVSFFATLLFSSQETAVRAIQLASLVLGAGYYTALTGWSGQTLGKMAAGIRVVRWDGKPVAMGRAFGRWCAYTLSSVTLGLGFLAAAFNKPRRTLHDWAAGTRVDYLPGTTKGRKAAMAGLGIAFVATAAALGMITAAYAPQQRELMERLSREGQTAATLNNLRVVVARYQDQFGAPPAALDDLTKLQDFPSLPTLDLPGHQPQNASVSYQNVGEFGKIDGPRLRDSGAWGYVADPSGKDPAAGTVFIDCTHTDSQGKAWHQY